MTYLKCIIVICLLGFCLSGCAMFRTNILKASQEDMKNAAVSRQVARNWLSTWAINSGIIRKAFQEIEQQLPCSCFAKMDRLDELAKKGWWTDFELGESLYLQFEIRGLLASEAVKKYLPDILKLAAQVGLL